MVTTNCGKRVVLIGGHNWSEQKKSNLLIELNGRSMKWVILPQILQCARSDHIAILISNDFKLDH